MFAADGMFDAAIADGRADGIGAVAAAGGVGPADCLRAAPRPPPRLLFPPGVAGILMSAGGIAAAAGTGGCLSATNTS
jgi:hypothetical protein